MKESHRKGVATHPDPESCVASSKATTEALTGAHVGRVSSCEIIASGVPTPYHVAEGDTTTGDIASLARTLRSLRPTHTWKLHAREPGDPVDTRREGCGASGGEGHELEVHHGRRRGVG